MPPKRFVFRLEVVLTVKLKKEEEEKKKLGDLIQLLQQEERVLARMHSDRDAANEQLREKQSSGQGMFIDELLRLNNWLKKLKKDIEQQQQKIREIKIAIEKQRDALLEAVKERQILEKLKEQHHEEFLHEIEEEEKKMIDELATLRYAREAGQKEDEAVT